MRAALTWAVVVVGGAGCRIDMGDCSYFDDCEPRLPSGLACGLAHGSLGHIGAGCEVDGVHYDPARRDHAWDVVDLGDPSATTQCPAGWIPTNLPDHDGLYGWQTCVAPDSAGFNSNDLGRIPEGAACGLSRVGGPTSTCLGVNPVLDLACPDGFSLRWFVDEYFDEVVGKGDCSVIPAGPNENPAGLSSRLYDLYLYCAVDEGCEAGTCDSERMPAGLLCGLHNRDWMGSCESAPDELRSAELEGFPDRDMETPLEMLSHYCFGDEALMAVVDHLSDRLDSATCMGVDVQEEGCPGGMELACTADSLYSDWDVPGEEFFFSTGDRECHVSAEAICWCAPARLRHAYHDMEGLVLFAEDY